MSAPGLRSSLFSSCVAKTKLCLVDRIGPNSPLSRSFRGSGILSATQVKTGSVARTVPDQSHLARGIQVKALPLPQLVVGFLTDLSYCCPPCQAEGRACTFQHCREKSSPPVSPSCPITLLFLQSTPPCHPGLLTAGIPPKLTA